MCADGDSVLDEYYVYPVWIFAITLEMFVF